MNPQRLFLLIVISAAVVTSCEKDGFLTSSTSVAPGKIVRADIGLDAFITNADLKTIVIPRSMGGYSCEARGRGTIPSGEYAGWKFQINLEAHYSGEGIETLEFGSAFVKMRGERFVSTMDPLLQSFCCGEGHLLMIDGEWIFSMFGQVIHTTADEPHNHLFAGLATTAGTMNMNIADQDSTVVIQADPPHNPGIGLLVGFDAQRVRVFAD